jgi:hypothetical protein
MRRHCRQPHRGGLLRFPGATPSQDPRCARTVSEACVGAGPAPRAASGARPAHKCAASRRDNVQPLAIQPNRAPDNVEPPAVQRYPTRMRHTCGPPNDHSAPGAPPNRSRTPLSGPGPAQPHLDVVQRASRVLGRRGWGKVQQSTTECRPSNRAIAGSDTPTRLARRWTGVPRRGRSDLGRVPHRSPRRGRKSRSAPDDPDMLWSVPMPCPHVGPDADGTLGGTPHILWCAVDRSARLSYASWRIAVKCGEKW